ncbi:hypothetical protein Ahy_A09g042308 [Arachis hypogaea]|uniref:BED-type domain-containing protein n=1 Tax=Arachis hypogaea TaxID=3818 RepID=A0A445BFI4_ARAHY|nr:hypothetical protein Ahy_A09g042308 [Arachis hypogaea]
MQTIVSMDQLKLRMKTAMKIVLLDCNEVRATLVSKAEAAWRKLIRTKDNKIKIYVTFGAIWENITFYSNKINRYMHRLTTPIITTQSMNVRHLQAKIVPTCRFRIEMDNQPAFSLGQRLVPVARTVRQNPIHSSPVRRRQQFFSSASRRSSPVIRRTSTWIRDSISLPRPPIRDSVFTLIRLSISLLLSSVACRSSSVENEVADRDVPMSESVEHSASTLPPLPTTSSEHKNRSTVWDHFKRTSDDENKAQCQHCLKVIKCGNGTSAMRSHLKICISNPSSDRGKR